MSLAKKLIKNSAINLTGQVLPLAVALFAIPQILKNLGEERLGVLALAWMFIGYFTLFDLGLGRAITKEISSAIASKSQKTTEIFWTGVLSTLGLGLLAGLIFYLLIPILIGRLLNIPPHLMEETRTSFQAIAFALPFVISAVSLRGILEAKDKFFIINLVQTPLGMFNYLVPLWLSTHADLGVIISYLMIVRVLSWAILAFAVLRIFPLKLSSPSSFPRFTTTEFTRLIRFGGWLTVSNLIGPIITYSDRILVGSVVSTTAVAYYSTPFEMIMRLWIIPSAIINVLFPTLSALSQLEIQKMKDIFWGGSKVILLLMFPIGLFLSCFSQEILSIWLGPDFANASRGILWWFGIGIIVNAVSFVPASFLQSRGRPDIPAKLLLVELPIYLTLLLVLLNQYGIEGAAIAWLIRTTFDLIFLFFFANSLLSTRLQFNLRFLAMVSLIVLGFVAITLNSGVLSRIVTFGFSCALFYIFSWILLFNERERSRMLSLFSLK